MENGPSGSGAGHDPVSVWSPGADRPSSERDTRHAVRLGRFGTNTAFSGPWGVSYTFNLTPEPNTGLGIWTEEMFVRTIRTGRHMGVSRPINPPMPWPAYRNATDEDLKAIYAYLRTIKPIVNHVPDYQPVEN